jgi:hypothetical protein
LVALAAGCSFDAGKSTDLAGNGGDDMSGGGGDDLSMGADMTQICTPGDKSCTGTMLQTCNTDGTGFGTTTCALGCNSTNTDCKALQPTAPAVAGDFVYGGLSDLTIAATQTLLIFNTDTGEIRDQANAVVRMPNATPMTRNVEDGIGFHRVSGVGIWTFTKLTVPATTTIVFKGQAGASILAAGDISIAGTIDARGYGDPTKALMTPSTLCMGTTAGPGGAIGGITATPPTGEGGSVADTTNAGGGGGYGATGGVGGNNGNGGTGGTAGAIAGVAAINPLAGGLGGGTSGGVGGGGGGALQLASEGTITVSGVINAGGCGGSVGSATTGGGGGGSGGAILLEAPTVHVAATGVLAANGGGGGGGGDVTTGGTPITAGEPGRPNATRASGGSGGMNGFAGGNGGFSGTPAGQSGSNGNGAGGGGGGVGRVRLNSSTGAATLDTNSTLSPAASQGTAVIQ